MLVGMLATTPNTTPMTTAMADSLRRRPTTQARAAAKMMAERGAQYRGSCVTSFFWFLFLALFDLACPVLFQKRVEVLSPDTHQALSGP